MSFLKITAAAAALALLCAAAPAVYAAEGTTLAGPAQGTKSNGEASMQPSAEAQSTTTATAPASGSNAGQQPNATAEQHEKLGN